MKNGALNKLIKTSIMLILIAVLSIFTIRVDY